MQPMLSSNRVCKYRRNIHSSCRQEWTKAKCYKDGFFKITIHLLMQKLSDVARVVSVVFWLMDRLCRIPGNLDPDMFLLDNFGNHQLSDRFLTYSQLQNIPFSMAFHFIAMHFII